MPLISVLQIDISDIKINNDLLDRFLFAFKEWCLDFDEEMFSNLMRLKVLFMLTYSRYHKKILSI